MCRFYSVSVLPTSHIFNVIILLSSVSGFVVIISQHRCQGLDIIFINRDHTYLQSYELKPGVFHVFFQKSHGNHTAGEVRWVRLHLHRSEVSDPDTTVQHRCHNTGTKQVSGIGTDQYCFLREYCKELKLSLNNTEFLLDFSQYIDRNTPNACESCFFSSLFFIW